MNDLFLKQEEFEKIFKSHIKVESYPKSIASLFNPRLLKKIDYKPYYQRNYVWDNDKATYFIESILLGTEVPPLIFFNNGEKIEVIDGRQRFETILRFRDDKFQLTNKGLLALKQLSKKKFSDLSSEELQIKEIFDDAKIRIIEFKIDNEPKLDIKLEDKIKKEIFSRYNSGITPLTKSEVDNARYDADEVSKFLKEKLNLDKSTAKTINNTFFQQKSIDIDKEPSVETIVNFVRKTLGLTLYPIKYYARGTGRTELMDKFYEFYINSRIEDKTVFYKNLIDKVNLIKNIHNKFTAKGLKSNWLVFDCLLWVLYILEDEGVDINYLNQEDIQLKFAKYISKNLSHFKDKDYHYYDETIDRYKTIAAFFEKEHKLSLYVYIQGDEDSTQKVKDVKKHKDTERTLSELENLRVTKPDPSRISIDDISKLMGRNRFIVRPSYQRAEVINLPKASAIIESILLGVPLPAIFIYKKKNGISEVIDGQQRLLTIIGFIGNTYLNEQNKEVNSKKHQFRLKDLRILKNLKNYTFATLDEKLQDKILDFELFVVEIQEQLNPNFNPIDLFIRLNDKPYPILLNSFEMWNSWVDVSTINAIKSQVKACREWFYLRMIENEESSDRMKNEELFTCLAYLDCMQQKNQDPTLQGYLDIYQTGSRIKVRITQKIAISSFLQETSEKDDTSQMFSKSIYNIGLFIENLKCLLGENSNNLKVELDNLFKTQDDTRYVKRTLQDFYILWFILNTISDDVINAKRADIIIEVKAFFKYMKNPPSKYLKDNKGSEEFIERIKLFRSKYK